MSKMKRISVLLFSLCLFAFVAAVPTFAAEPDSVTGLVFIDKELDGIWDAGEEGYSGVWSWVEDEEIWRHVGAIVTITSPAYDEFVLESSGPREAEYDGESALCSYQDTLVDDELNPSPIRPCVGTWGLPGVSEDVRFMVTVTAPAGYYVTSENPQYFTTGTDQGPLNFGIAPLATK
ncbi:MAG: hypothetical protein IPM39_05715 [Chloroflexi bacterium]|nr:hypothetical protein [Chloroflexota bacterium]